MLTNAWKSRSHRAETKHKSEIEEWKVVKQVQLTADWFKVICMPSSKLILAWLAASRSQFSLSTEFIASSTTNHEEPSGHFCSGIGGAVEDGRAEMEAGILEDVKVGSPGAALDLETRGVVVVTGEPTGESLLLEDGMTPLVVDGIT